MSRTRPRLPGGAASSTESAENARTEGTLALRPGWEAWAWAVRIALLVVFPAFAVVLHPFGFNDWRAVACGLFAAVATLLIEQALRRAGARGVIGGGLGLLAGVLSAAAISAVAFRSIENSPTKTFLDSSVLIGLGYLGLLLGSKTGEQILARDSIRPDVSADDSEPLTSYEKLLDTSVLIDGRIADICEAHFLDGPLVVPQFVLKELQFVADSADTLRRQRGRRGLEVLQRMQKMLHVEVRVLDEDAPDAGDVDHKLIEVARKRGAKIVTNDFNLNKVARVQGISVLNVNELANALRPAVLPGEAMRVFVLREGKEANQGVAFLEDGTMVVVDGAKRLINKSVDILVTSVHQTPAGKMIFGRVDERSEQTGVGSKQSGAAAGDRGPRSAVPGAGN